MSYDIYLHDPATQRPIIFEESHQLRGGTYEVGGSRTAWLNVTYNYSKWFHKVMGKQGIRTIYGMTGADSIPVLEAGIAQLGTNVTDNYWEPTEGNARVALTQLLALAEMRPDGIWNGD